MKRLSWPILFLLMIPAMALAIVTKPGVSDSRYLVPDSSFPALVDLPGEGQGVLIAPRWVVTVGHATQGYMLMRVRIRGKWREIAHVFLYPGFKQQFANVRKASEHPTLKNWPMIKAAFASMHDIALIELAKPVEDVKPVLISPVPQLAVA